MLARRMNESHPAYRLREEMDRLFNDFLGEFRPFDSFRTLGGRGFPAVNLWEDAENFYVEAELPGLRIEDVELQVTGNELTIKGHREAQEGDNLNYHRRERGTGEFARILTLPTEADPDKVAATLKDGVLTVTLPKAETARPRQIKIKAQ